MTEESYLFHRLLKKDTRYPLAAYLFVREALAFTADAMELGNDHGEQANDFQLELDGSQDQHITGQQLCEGIRRYAINQFGYMAKVVLRNWNINSTSCFGDLVYNMIEIGVLKKSDDDSRAHFDDVYRFDEVFQIHFEVDDMLVQRRN